MNKLFSAMGICKQSFHQYHNRLLLRLQEEAYVVKLINEIRRDYPTMGCRDMYFKLAPSSLGRDAFEELCRQQGFMVKRTRSFRPITDSRGVIRYDNLTNELKLTTADQLWFSDIACFEVDNRFYYLTFIIHAFIRRILGYSASSRLFTEETTLAALKMDKRPETRTNTRG